MVVFQEGWGRIHDEAVVVLEEFLESGTTKDAGKEEDTTKRIFTVQDYSELYTLVYDMCTQRSPNNWSQHLYQKYGETITNYITKSKFGDQLWINLTLINVI